MKKLIVFLLIVFLLPLCLISAVNIRQYDVFELTFIGSSYRSVENPVRDIELVTTWQNSSSAATIHVYGFFDGSGDGSPAGNCFKVRFCPLAEGTWTLIRVQSNDRKLNNQHQGLQIVAAKSDKHGFWEVDAESQGRRWYRRSDGTHQYIVGNTMYSFLSEFESDKPSGGNITDDVINNSKFFKKIRIGITGDKYPNPVSKPFLDNNGIPSDDGNFSCRPNPEWFFSRLDKAVSAAYENDLIIDLILNGPDTPESRSILNSENNNSDTTPFLKYIAARYGSYPNVWICLANEYDIKTPKYSCAQINRAGEAIRRYLPYSTPVSVHAAPDEWNSELNSSFPWFDHVIVQSKLKKMDQSADAIIWNYILGEKVHPVINDELAYEGEGDGWSEEDVIEAFLGAFTGGGYGSTGFKTGQKTGHYFTGNFNPDEHKSADNLKWFRGIIDNNISFWKMQPVPITDAFLAADNIFRNVTTENRILAWCDEEYVIAGNSSKKQVTALLPQGKWTIKVYDIITMSESTVGVNVSGKFVFNFPDSRAAFFHFKKE